MINFLKLPTTWKWRIQKAGLSVNDVADKLDMKASNVSPLINLRMPPSLNKLQEIEQILEECGEPFHPAYIDYFDAE